MKYDKVRPNFVLILAEFRSKTALHGLIITTLTFLLISCLSCNTSSDSSTTALHSDSTVYLHVLGTVQDAGYPQMGCVKDCCKDAWGKKQKQKLVSCLGLSDPTQNALFLFDATPDLKHQWSDLQRLSGIELKQPTGIFVTHAHTGHYTGLMDLGKESMGSNGVHVYAMPRMDSFLRSNGPWSQLVQTGQINLVTLTDHIDIEIGQEIKIGSYLVPHRDEYSETVGFRISGPNKTALFIPDIDKWERWRYSIAELITDVDYVFLDGTFFDDQELPGRDMSKIPHPFVLETMELLKDLAENEKGKVHFIHLNHTNPLLDENSAEYKLVLQKGFKVAKQGSKFKL